MLLIDILFMIFPILLLLYTEYFQDCSIYIKHKYLCLTMLLVIIPFVLNFIKRKLNIIFNLLIYLYVTALITFLFMDRVIVTFFNLDIEDNIILFNNNVNVYFLNTENNLLVQKSKSNLKNIADCLINYKKKENILEYIYDFQNIVPENLQNFLKEIKFSHYGSNVRIFFFIKKNQSFYIGKKFNFNDNIKSIPVTNYLKCKTNENIKFKSKDSNNLNNMNFQKNDEKEQNYNIQLCNIRKNDKYNFENNNNNMSTSSDLKDKLINKDKIISLYDENTEIYDYTINNEKNNSNEVNTTIDNNEPIYEEIVADNYGYGLNLISKNNNISISKSDINNNDGYEIPINFNMENNYSNTSNNNYYEDINKNKLFNNIDTTYETELDSLPNLYQDKSLNKKKHQKIWKKYKEKFNSTKKTQKDIKK